MGDIGLLGNRAPKNNIGNALIAYLNGSVEIAKYPKRIFKIPNRF